MIRRLAFDFFTFLTMLLYWISVALLIYPLKRLDRLLGTRLSAPLVRLTKIIGNL